MPRQDNQARKRKATKKKQHIATKNAASSLIVRPKQPTKRNKITRKLDDVLPATTDIHEVSTCKTYEKATGGQSTKDENDSPSHDVKKLRRSTRAATANQAKPPYFEAADSTTEDDDSDDEVDLSTMSSPVGKKLAGGKRKKRENYKVLAENNKRNIARPSSTQKKSPKKKAFAIATVETPIFSGVDFKRPSPASSIKDITRTMWQDNISDWRVENAMDY